MTNERQPTMNDIGTSIAYIIIIFIVITYSIKTVYNQINHIKYLNSNSWLVIKTQIFPNYSINVLQFRDGSKNLSLNYNNELFYSQNCDTQLQYICQSIADHKVNIQSFHFYVLTDPTTGRYSSFHLKDIAFIDNANNVQIFPYTDYAPNHPKFINAEK